MAKINLKELEIYKDITQREKVKGDAREDVANLLYMGCTGVAAHALAFKIFKSDGEIELDDQETALLKQAVDSKCRPVFIDAINEQLNRM